MRSGICHSRSWPAQPPAGNIGRTVWYRKVPDGPFRRGRLGAEDAYEDRGVGEDEAEERAARTVDKTEPSHGETKAQRAKRS